MTTKEKLREILDNLLADWANGKVDNPMQTEQQILTLFEPLSEALNLILPLAKGYAANHQVDSNQKYIEIAQQAITKSEGDIK